MFKSRGIQAISISCALMLLASCKWGSSPNGTAHVSPLIKDPHVQPEYKMQRLAAQLDTITTQNVHDTLGGTNPSYLQNNNVFFEVDGFYWKAFEDNLEHAVIAKQEYLELDGQPKTVRFRWNPGVRLGIGYLFGNHDQWDLSFKWTYYRTEARASENSHDITQKKIYSSWMPQFLGTYSDQVSAHWQFNYNLWDLEVGRDYFISRNIAIRPFASLRVASLRQDFRIKYNALFVNGPTVAGFSTKMEADNDFLGGGPRFGMDMMWHFHRHWGICAQFSGSLLYSNFDVDQEFKGRFPVSLTPYEMEIDRSFNRVRPNLETSLGLEFETPVLYQGKNHLSIAVMYELSYWFQQNQLAKLPVTSFFGTSANNAFDYEVPGGDIGLQGATLKIQYNF